MTEGSSAAELQNFFVAITGVSGALIGLLFVAIAVAPDRIIGAKADSAARETALGAFLVLTNVLMYGLSGLLPDSVGSRVLLMVAGASVTGTVLIAAMSLRYFRDWSHMAQFRWVLRRLATLALMVWQLVLAYRLVFDGSQSWILTSLTVISLLLTIIGLDRCWELLGGERRSLLGTVEKAVDGAGSKPRFDP